MNAEVVLRPRWGTFSVIDHLDVTSLISEILLYDRLVFPAPADDDEWKRWEDNGWQPELLLQRIHELGDLAHPTRWTRRRREEWADRWERFKQLGRDTQGLAYGLTPTVLAADSVWNDLVPPPIMVAAYQNPNTATADLSLVQDFDIKRHAREHLHREVGALFERRLQMPIVEDPQRTYEKAIELAHDTDFQRARRSLFEWEDQRIADDWPAEAAIKEYGRRVETYNEYIDRSFLKVWTPRVWRVLSFVTPTLVASASGNPFVGLGAAGALQLVETRLPSLSQDAADPLDRPEAALHVAISAMYHDLPRNE